MIDPNAISTIRVEQLGTASFSLTDNIPHEVSGVLKKGTIQSLSDFIASVLGTSEAVGYLALAVVDGQQLPDVPENPSFFLCGKGTFLNINGFDDLVCSDDLNVIMSLSDHWEIAVGIPITVDPVEIGISQTINSGVTDFAPSENAVYNALHQWLNTVGSFHYADLASQTTPQTTTSNVPLKILNDSDGDNTNISNAPYAVSILYSSVTNQLNFTELSIGDLVTFRPDLNVTTSGANKNIKLYLKMAIGSGDDWILDLCDIDFKDAGVQHINYSANFDIANNSTKDYPAELCIVSDDAASIVNNGYYFSVLRKNINIVDLITDEAPIDGNLYGRKDAGWEEILTPNLSQVLTEGNETSGNDVLVSNGDAVIFDNGSKVVKGTTDAGLGGNKGVALRCSVDYELKWEAGRLYVMEQDGFTVREVSHNFTTTPTVTDDTTKGFIVDSRWILDNGNVYVCTDNTTASAVWELQTSSGGATNLSYTPSPTDGTVTSDTGTDATLTIVDGTNAGLVTPSMKSTWDGKQDALGFTPYNATNPSGYQTSSQVQAIADAQVSDTAYDATTWDGVTGVAPSKNAVRDKIESLVTGVALINGLDGYVILTQDDILDGITYKQYSDVEKSKLSGIATGANVGVVPNTAITGATKTKITYDSKGLVTAGADATTADISDSTDKRYQTDNQQSFNDATSSIQTQLNGKQPSGSYLTSYTETDPIVKAINGIVKSNGTTISAAVAGTDYLTPTGSAAGLTSFPTLNQNTTGTAGGLSANIPQTRVTNLTTDLAAKQATLVSGTNIKTINSTSLLGSGDITAGDMILASTQTNSGLKTFLTGTIGLRNVANTFTALFTNTNTAARTYTFQDKTGTIADLVDVATKMANPSLTASYIPKALTTTTIGNSRLFDTGTFLGIGTNKVPTDDLTFKNQADRTINIENSSNVNNGNNLTISAGNTINYLEGTGFLSLYTNLSAVGRGITVEPTSQDVYVAIGGLVYKKTGNSGYFVNDVAGGDGNQYRGMGFDSSGNIYITMSSGGYRKKSSGTWSFITPSGVSGAPSCIGGNNLGDLYIGTGTALYKQTGGTGSWVSVYSGNVDTMSISQIDNSVYIFDYTSGVVYKQTAGTGSFVSVLTSSMVRGLSCAPDGNVYALVFLTLYKQTSGTGAFVTTGFSLPSGNWGTGLSATSNSSLYGCADTASDIYFYSTTPTGLANLSGGKLIFKDGTGKGNSNTAGVEIWTGQTTTSGTNMQTSTLRLKADNSGLLTLPSTTNTIIDGDSTGKAIVTKEYVAAHAQTGQIIVTSGISFTTPSTITTATIFNIELVGAGGGGGGGVSSGNGSGGAAGGYVFKRITGLSPSTTYPCTIGVAGSAGANSANGTAGTSTTLTIGVTTYTASGGGFGIGAASSAGGTGGTGTNGDLNISGENGEDSPSASTASVSGRGGSSAKGWGTGGTATYNTLSGRVGTGYGAGGSSGHGLTGSPTGAAGTQGIIFCQWFN